MIEMRLRGLGYGGLNEYFVIDATRLVRQVDARWRSFGDCELALFEFQGGGAADQSKYLSC
jgi:hypothetical protein